MDKIELSIIFPFREKIHLFERLMKSLKETTHNPAQIEILIAIDEDDTLAKDNIPYFKNKYPEFKLDFFPRTPNTNFVKNYWNFLACMARGRWILAVNDDCQFRTNDWDEILIGKMNAGASKVGDDILHGLIKDSVNRRKEDPLFPHFSCWCLQSKEAVNALGYFYLPKCRFHGPDQAVSKVYRELGRLVSLTEIFIEGELSEDVSDKDIKEEVIKLQDYIYEKERKRHGG